MRNELRVHCSKYKDGCTKTLKTTRAATLFYVNYLFVVIGFPLALRFVFILHIYSCLSHTCEKNCHILIGRLFVNLRLTHEPCSGITIVSLLFWFTEG